MEARGRRGGEDEEEKRGRRKRMGEQREVGRREVEGADGKIEKWGEGR